MIRCAASTSAASWDLLPYRPAPSELNFAFADALLRHLRRPAVWAHSTDRPTLIIGAGQRLVGLDPQGARRAHFPIVRRQAGGTSVLALPGTLGVDVALPVDHPLALADVVEAYRWFGETWLDAVRNLGADARLVELEEARRGYPPGPFHQILRLACFGTLSPYEVAVGTRKLVGLAQVRRKTGVMWQSGIHLRFPAEELAGILARVDAVKLAAALRERAVGLDEVVTSHSSATDVARVFYAALRRHLGIELRPRNWSDQESAHALAVAPTLIAKE